MAAANVPSFPSQCFPDAPAILAAASSSLSLPKHALLPATYRFSLRVSRPPLSLNGAPLLSRLRVLAAVTITALPRPVPSVQILRAGAFSSSLPASAPADLSADMQLLCNTSQQPNSYAWSLVTRAAVVPLNGGWRLISALCGMTGGGQEGGAGEELRASRQRSACTLA